MARFMRSLGYSFTAESSAMAGDEQVRPHHRHACKLVATNRYAGHRTRVVTPLNTLKAQKRCHINGKVERLTIAQ